jgi:outer membrane protein assembly factor BamB
LISHQPISSPSKEAGMKRRVFIILIIFLSSLFLFTFIFNEILCLKADADIAETTGLADTAWPCEGHDSRRTSQSPYLGPQTSTLKWSYQTGGGFYSSPAIGIDGTIYFGSRDFNLYAFDPNGNLKWSYKTGGGIYSSPAVSTDGAIFFGSNDPNSYSGSNENYLYALDPNGNLKWRVQTGDWIYSSAIFASDGTIYFGSHDNHFYALNRDGTIKWTYKTNGANSSPALGSDGTVYFGSYDANLYALDPNGNLKWKYPTSAWIGCAPAIGDEGMIYIGSGNKIYAINPEGNLKWSFKITPGGHVASLAIGADGTVYFASEESVSIEIDWGLYQYCYDRYINALDPNGSLKWSSGIGRDDCCCSMSSPAIGANGTIYIGSIDRKIYAIDPDGSFRWSYKTGDRINSSPVIGADGTLYVGSDDGKVYAFRRLEDTEPPEIICPGDIIVNAPGSGTRVTYSSSVTDNIDHKPVVIYDPPLDFIFPTGITEVSITATDISGNSTNCIFTITVGQGGVGLADSAWPCRGHDPRHTGQSPYLGVQNNTLKWSYKTGGYIFSSPVIGADNTIYIGSYDGNLYALDPNGGLKWKYKTEEGVYSTPIISADNTVYVGSTDGYFYALNPDGSLKWDFYTGGWEGIKSSPIIDPNGTIYVARWENKIYALNPDGTLKWSYQTEKSVWSSPAIGNDGTIYIGCDDNRIYALQPEDGSLKWSYETGDDVFSSPAVDNDGTVFVGSFDGKVYALNPEDGSIKWTYRIGDNVYTSPVISTNGILYVGGMNGKLYALHKEDGSMKWSYQTGEGIYSSPAIGADGTIYVGGMDSWVYAFDPDDGSVKWTYKTDGDIISSPAIGSDGIVYIGSNDGNLYAFMTGEDIEDDLEPPEIICPSDMTVLTLGNLEKVTYTAKANDSIDPNPLLIYAPEPCSPFPLGTTFVNVVATDYSGNSSTCFFNVTVEKSQTQWGGPANSAWPFRGYDLKHTGQSPYIGTQSNILKWTFQTGDDIESSPAIGPDGTIYFGSRDKKVYALYQDGSVKWSFQTGDQVESSPAIAADGTIYIGSRDKKLYALNPDGSLKWSFQTVSMVNSSPAIGIDGTIYFGGGDGDNKIYALNSDGSLKWTYETRGYISSSPAIGDDGTVYYGSYDGKLYALNPQDGSLKWSYQMGHIWSSPAIGEDCTVYIGSGDNWLYVFNPDGSLKWRYETDHWIFSSPAISVDGTVYGNGSMYLYAISPEGRLRWKYNTENPAYYSSPALGADGTIYFGAGHDVHAINPDGSPKWKYNTEGAVWSSPAIGSDGTVYVGSNDGKIYAFGEDKSCYIDMDHDGYGDTNQGIQASACPSGYVENNSDCNDQDGLINPGAHELCDEKDNDCDGLIDEEGALDCINYYLDKDKDGYGVYGDNRCLCASEGNYSAIQEGDSDDLDPNISVVDMDIKLDLPAGWSMISLPVVPYGTKISDLFPGAVVVYGYKKGVGYFRMANEKELEFGKGYWILLDEDQSYHLLGRSIHEYAFSVHTDGWYMIGGCTYSAQPVSDTCTIDVIYEYAQEIGYQRTETLEPGKGYWILFGDIADRATINLRF